MAHNLRERVWIEIMAQFVLLLGIATLGGCGQTVQTAKLPLMSFRMEILDVPEQGKIVPFIFLRGDGVLIASAETNCVLDGSDSGGSSLFNLELEGLGLHSTDNPLYAFDASNIRLRDGNGRLSWPAVGTAVWQGNDIQYSNLTAAHDLTVTFTMYYFSPARGKMICHDYSWQIVSGGMRMTNHESLQVRWR